MTALLAHFGGRELAGFILVLARVTPLFVIAPALSAKMIPLRARSVAAVALALGLTPLALHGQLLPTSAVALLELLTEQLLVGFGFAFAFAVLIGAIETAGGFLDFSSGISFGNLINPELGIEGSAFTELYALIGALIFVVIGGIEWMVRGLARTFALVPLGGTVRVGTLTGGVEATFATIFTSALEVIAPVLIAMAITDVAFGVLSKVVPQMNIFAIGFPLKVVVAVLLVAATLPFLGNWLVESMGETVGSALAAIHAG